MKKCSIDCQIHYQHNVIERLTGNNPDQDGSAACDYDICRYQCINPTPVGFDPVSYQLLDQSKLDVSTYDVYYSDRDIELAATEISDLFKRHFTMTLEEVYQSLSMIRRKFIDLAIYRIIQNKRILYNRYGFSCYLQLDGDTLFLTQEYPSKDQNKMLTFYTANLIATENRSISDFVSNLQGEDQNNIIQHIEKRSLSDDQIYELIEQLNNDYKAKLLEESVYRRVIGGDLSKYIDIVITKFSQMFFMMNEPVTELKSMNDSLSHRGRGPGRKPGPTSKIKVKKLENEDLEQITEANADQEQVYLHILYTQVTGQTAYAVVSKSDKAEGRIRILKPSENRGWRDLNTYEAPVYSGIIQLLINKRKEPFEQYTIYGTILSDGVFRIRSKIHENTELAKKDNRTKKRGKKCTTWFKPELMSILWNLGVEPPTVSTIETTDRDTIINYLLQQKGETTSLEKLNEFSDEQLQFYYRWYRSGATRNAICSILRQHLQDNNMIYYIS
jgi:hypothetical protein